MSKVKFRWCTFVLQNSIAQLQSVLQNKQNLTGLCLDHCDFIGGRVYEDVISALLRPDSPLRSFELMERSLGDVAPTCQFLMPNTRFRNLLRAVEKSKLEHFAIGILEYHEQLRNLTESIPKMGIKELQVAISDAVDEEDTKPLLLQAIKNNFSLRFVDCNRGRDVFDADDKMRLVFYANRNERLDEWVGNPETVQEQKVWPEALTLAERAGPNSLFRGLRSVVESDYVSWPAGRKRKRPQDDGSL